MTQDELRNTLIGKNVSSTTYGIGIVSEVKFNDKDIYLGIEFTNNDSKITKTYSINIAITKDIIKFEDICLKNITLMYVKSMQSNTNKITETTSASTHNINISKREDINIIIRKVKENKSFALDLISKYDDADFERTLLDEAFNRISRYIDGYYISDSYKEEILVALSYIALKYYDGEFHNQIFSQYKKYMGNESDNSIRNAYYKCIKDYRPSYKYFDSKSYNAVPIIACVVPHSRLKDLYFISYDIYKKKLLFDEDVTDDQIKTKISESLLYLRNKGLIDTSAKDDEKIKGTEYLMSKYTQSIIYSGVCFDDLVKIITKCIRYIILHLTRKEDAFVVEPYYYEAYTEWTNDFDNNTKEKSKYEKTKLLSRPYFTLKGKNKIILNTGEFCMDESYDPNNVSIEIYENEELKDTIALNEPNDIIFNEDGAMSGYIVNRKSITLNCNPINKISYKIKCFEKEIYNSKDRLYRKILFFNGEGKEIKPGTEYNGQLFVITKDDNHVEYEDNINTIFEGNTYFISILNIESNVIYRLDNEPYLFSKISGAKMTGYIVPWANFISMENKKYEIYKDASFLFEASCDKEDVYVEIDGTKIRYGEDSILNYRIYLYSNDYNGMFVYKIIIYNLESGYHNIKIYNGKSNKILNNCDFNFVYDSIFSKTFVEKNTNGIKYNLESNLITEAKELDYEYGNTLVSFDSFVKGLGHGKLNIFPSTISFSLDNNTWNDLDRKLYLCDISNNMVYITGPENLKVIYVTDDNIINRRLLNLSRDSSNPFKYVLHLDYLMNLKDKIKAKIEFQYGSTKKYCMAWYNPYIKTEECKISFNDENKTLFLNFKYESHAKLFLKVFETKENKTLFSKKIQSDEDVTLDLSNVDKSIKYIQVSLHTLNQKSIFEPFKKEPIITFKKINISEDKFLWLENPLNCYKYDSIKQNVYGTFKFDGVSKIKLNLCPSGFNYLLKTCEVKSNQFYKFKLSYIFNAYNILIYKFNDKENKYEEEPFYITKSIKADSKFLHKSYKIDNYIFEDNNFAESQNFIKFNKLIEINNKLYLLCQFINKIGNISMDDVLIGINDEFSLGSYLEVNRLSEGKINKIKHKSGNLIKCITLTR